MLGFYSSKNSVNANRLPFMVHLMSQIKMVHVFSVAGDGVGRSIGNRLGVAVGGPLRSTLRP